MKYQSKKDPTIEAAFDFEDEKCKTTRLIYLTGEKRGTSFVIANTTLKRYWTPITDNPLHIDVEQVNKPYKPDVTPHYIPKPQSVIEYEERKMKKLADFDYIKDYDEFADELAKRNVVIKKVNAGYISLSDNTKIKILGKGIGILASEDWAEKFSKNGFIARPCIEKGTPFRFDICTEEDYLKMWDVFSE